MNEEKEVLEENSNISINKNNVVEDNNNQSVNLKPKNNEKQKHIGTFRLVLLRLKWLLFGIIVGLIMCFIFNNKFKTNVGDVTTLNNSKINIDYLTGTLRTMSDLITSELEYQGIVEKTNIKTAWIYKEEEKYLMVYRAQLKAGIDLSKVTIEESLNSITVTMPHATIKDKKILPSTIKFYNIKEALFMKSDGKLEAIEAQKLAESDVDENANLNSLINSAETQAKAVIKGLVDGIISDKEIIFNFYENSMDETGAKENTIETTKSMETQQNNKK